MRSTSIVITALMILAAFVLGLALGGQVPREAIAADESEEIGWKTDGTTLVLANLTQHTYLAHGAFGEGSNAPAPDRRTDGILEVSGPDLDGMVLFRLDAVLLCDRLGCRPCDEMPALCPVPPRPIPEGEFDSYLHPF
jgi:hypothetical protein